MVSMKVMTHDGRAAAVGHIFLTLWQFTDLDQTQKKLNGDMANGILVFWWHRNLIIRKTEDNKLCALSYLQRVLDILFQLL